MLGIHQLMGAARDPAAALPVETHQSYLVPVAGSRGVKAAFFFCRSVVTFKEGLRFLPPGYVAELDLTTGRLLRMYAVIPADFSRADPEDQILGQYNMLPDGRTS